MQSPRRRVSLAYPGEAAVNDADDFSDLSEERPLPDPIDLSQARPAPRCECPEALYDAEDPYNCLVCGRLLPGAAQGVAEAA